MFGSKAFDGVASIRSSIWLAEKDPSSDAKRLRRAFLDIAGIFQI